MLKQSITNAPILLIGGTGRSGTTIFRKVIECHPQVATVPEWRLLTDPDGIVEYLMLLENGNPFMADQAYRRLAKLLKDLEGGDLWSRVVSRFRTLDEVSPWRITSRYFGVAAKRVLPNFSVMAAELLEELADFHWRGQYSGMKLGQSKCVAGILGNLEDAEEACRRFLHRIAEAAMDRAERPRFLEKNTWSLLHFDWVSRLYPSGKMVHIHRDPRDVVASYIKQPWMPSEPEQAALTLKRLMELWWRARQGVDPARWMEISLGDLVADTERVLYEVCAFWEIDFHPELMKIDLSRSNSGRWHTELSAEQQTRVNAILGDIIVHYGYADDY